MILSKSRTEIRKASLELIFTLVYSILSATEISYTRLSVVMKSYFWRRKSSAGIFGQRATSLNELHDDVLVRVMSYFSVKERVVNARISRRFDECINTVWKFERLFPFFDRFGFVPSESQNLPSISEKNHLQLLLKATNVRAIDTRAIPVIYPSDDEWFANLGKKLSKLNSNIEEVKINLQNDFGLNILCSYLSNLENNRIKVIHLYETDDLSQVASLFKLLEKYSNQLQELHFDYPDDDSNRVDELLKVIGPRLIVLSCAQFMKFNLGSSLQVLDTQNKEIEEDELRLISNNCHSLRIIRGIIRGNQENYFSLKKLKQLQVISLADFHFDIGLENLKEFILHVGHNLLELSLHNLVKYESTGLWSVIISTCVNLEKIELNACLCIDDTRSATEFLESLGRVNQNLHVILKNSWIAGVTEENLIQFQSRFNNVRFTTVNYAPEFVNDVPFQIQF